MADLLTPADLAPFAMISEEKATEMIVDAVAMATLAAPCLGAVAQIENPLTDDQLAATKAVLRAAVLRWNEAGTGVSQSQTMGPFGATIDTRQPRRNMFWPSEIESLQQICRGDDATKEAFAVDTATAAPMVTRPILGDGNGWNSWAGGWSDDGTYLPFAGGW